MLVRLYYRQYKRESIFESKQIVTSFTFAKRCRLSKDRRILGFHSCNQRFSPSISKCTINRKHRVFFKRGGLSILALIIPSNCSEENVCARFYARVGLANGEFLDRFQLFVCLHFTSVCNPRTVGPASACIQQLAVY